MLINQFQQHHPNPIPSVGSSPNKPAGPMTNSKAQLKGWHPDKKRGVDRRIGISENSVDGH